MDKVVEILHMNKSFGPTVALKDVSLTAYGGEILGLIGENGSGKSTITSIFSGMQKCDSGQMLFMGQQWNPLSMTDALSKGVGMIVQENGTVPGITVAQNIFLGSVRDFRKGPFVDRKALIESARKALSDIGADHIDASLPVAALDFQDRKIVEIAKVMVKNPTVLVVDETTTALSQKGRDIIYSIMRRMADSNRTVIFISHDLDEIMTRCDRLTVLRDGSIIRTFSKDEFDEDEIKKSMIGRELQGSYYRDDYDEGVGEEVVISGKDMCLSDQLRDFSFELHRGEILGIGGLSHCGMHTLGKVLFGAQKLESGSFEVNGKTISSEKQAIASGIGYVAKDRDTQSLCLEAPIKDNIAIAGLDRFALASLLLLPARERKYVQKQIEGLQIKCNSMDQYVSTLSGGNKQKVAFGKWIGRDSEILILDCPTRGVDIGVKQAMYRLMYEMKCQGKAVLLISEEMSELIGMSDNLIVMKDGAIASTFRRSRSLCEADIIRYMI